MGKKWITFFVIAVVGILATTAYAADKMVIILDLTSQNGATLDSCYGANSIDASGNSVTVNGAEPCGTIDSNAPVGQRSAIRIKRHGQNPSLHVIKLPDHTIFESDSPGCVTYWYHGRSYTVCN